MTEIIEKFLLGKRPDQRLCEDGLFISGDFIAAVDGVSSRAGQKWNGLASGGYAKEVILSALEKMPRDIDAVGFFTALDAALAAAYEKDIIKDDRSEWLRANMVAYSDARREIWRLGDCRFMINGELFEGGKKVDTLMSDLRSFVVQHAIKSGEQIDDLNYGNSAVTPFILMQYVFENDPESEFGFGVLNGHGVERSFIERTPVSAGDTVVLASDGYPYLCDTLAESEQKLAAALKADPMCYKEIRGTKGIAAGNCSFDDRCYVRFRVI